LLTNSRFEKKISVLNIKVFDIVFFCEKRKRKISLFRAFGLKAKKEKNRSEKYFFSCGKRKSGKKFFRL